MSVYVDPLIATKPYHASANKRWNWNQSCHMTSDTPNELHAMAERLGLKREWFQCHHPNPKLHHYDLTANKRFQAIRFGALEITHLEAAKRLLSQEVVNGPL